MRLFLPEVLDTEGRSRAQRVLQHQVLQPSVLLILRQTLTGQNLPPLHCQILHFLQETRPGGGRKRSERKRASWVCCSVVILLLTCFLSDFIISYSFSASLSPFVFLLQTRTDPRILKYIFFLCSASLTLHVNSVWMRFQSCFTLTKLNQMLLNHISLCRW